MQIKRLYIKDFGIFNNQSLNDLDSNIVVIGGLSRAGKTTLMNILRYVGYGFPRSNDLPPARNKYQIESDILFNNREFNIQLSGYAVPNINLKQDDEISSIRDIYHLDYFTYQQLFTLSLDELKRVPSGVDDQEKLQSILIGAGFSEILQLPQLEDYFNKEADKIGGKRGDPKVKSFKPYYNNIHQGLNKREEANSHLEEYQRAKKNLQEIKQEIRDNENNLNDLNYKRDRLDVLKNNYSDYKKLIDLNTKLDNPEIRDLLNNFPGDIIQKIKNLYNDYRNKLKEYKDLISQFEKEISDGDGQNTINKLLKHREQIDTYSNELSGLRERINYYKKNSEEQQSDKEELISRARKINENWQSEQEFNKILAIDTDILEIGKLNQVIGKYNEVQNKISNLKEDITEIQSLFEKKMERRKEEEENQTDSFGRKYFYAALGFVGGGFGLTFINLWLGLITGFAGIGGMILYGINHIIQNNKNQDLQLSREIDDIEDNLEYKKEELCKWRDELSNIKDTLEKYSDIFGLEKDTSPEIIRDYYREVQRLKKEIIEWQNQSKKLNEMKRKIKKELEAIIKLLQKFSIFTLNFVTDSDIIENTDLVFKKVENLYEYTELAVSLNQKEQEVDTLEEKINKLLDSNKRRTDLIEEIENFLEKGKKYNRYNELKLEMDNLRVSILNSLKTDRIKESLGDYQDKKITREDNLLEVFDSIYRDYTSPEDINTTYNQCENKIESIRDKLENLKEKRQSIKDKINKLQTSTKLTESQKEIDKNRRELRKLAENYAVNKTAEYILSRVRKRFMDKTKNKLFDRASKTFNQMTNGEYKQILPPDKLTEVDFKAVLNNENKQKTNVLSRGTKEQLFLAVRLSRIKKITPPLPVIMDDTLVNFDRFHLDQTLEIFSDLSKSHQIFVLTCHPHFIKYLSDKKSNIQYWKLKDGIFSRSNAEQLITHLSKKS